MAAVLESTENWDDDFEFHENHSRSSRPDNHLSDWAEPGPSRRQSTTENWDDDFEDKLDSPPPKRPSGSRPENWDDEFDHDDDDDDDLDFNAPDRDDDHTVTARSRRTALSRLTTPPPPVPPIPFALLNSSEQPFPRSPTASVFSVPTSGRDSVAYSYYHNNSTTHLRPTTSRTSSTGFANLPPSPPIHKERERRRLRKKSRPSEPVYEMSTRHPVLSSRESLGLPEEDEPMTSATPPPTSPEAIPVTPSSNRNSINFSVGLTSPTQRTPLLSRIGSVKKWSTRKKRSSSTPSEVMQQQVEYEQGPIPSSSPPTRSNWFFRTTGNGNQPSDTSMTIDESDFNTPRKPSKPDSSYDTSAKLIKRKSFGFVPIGKQNSIPFNDRGANNRRNDNPIPPMPGSQSDLPSDLETELKTGTDSDIAAGRSPSKKKKSSNNSQSRHTSYGGIGLGRASTRESSDDLHSAPSKPKTRSFSRSKSRDKRAVTDTGNEDVPMATEGSRTFMGSVRRISLVGRHKRTKSGVSLSGVTMEETLRHRSRSKSPIMDPPPPPPPPQAPHHNHDYYNPYKEMDIDPEPLGSRTPSRSSNLLPPIELQPPSPPRVNSSFAKANWSTETQNNLDNLLLPSSSPPKSPSSPSIILKASPKASPQSASLGRSTVAPSISVNTNIISGSSVPRRNSLGDLKIPARITRAQDGLRRDLGMVREFAANVEQLKELVSTYNDLVTHVQGVIDARVQQSSSRAASPSFFRPLSRARPITPSQDPHSYQNMASTFYTIRSKYKAAWECAELLIELGGGPPASTSTASPPSTSTSAPVISTQRVSIDGNSKKGRERAVTLSGEESKPPTPIPGATPSSTSQGPPIASPPNMSWRASTGRHDLSQRQLLLLREMLNNPDSTFVSENQNPRIPLDDSTMVNRDWRWGEGMSSTVTLPSEESSALGGGGTSRISDAKKRRTSRLGMSGLRDMLKMLTRSSQQNQNPPPIPSSTSLSTESSVECPNSNTQHRYPHNKVPTYGRRRAKTSTGPDSVSSMRERDGHGEGRAPSPYNAVNLSSLSVKSSPRRPSLASIFRIGNKTKSSASASSSNNISVINDDGSVHPHTRESSSSTGDTGEEDWDRIDSPWDLEPQTGVKSTSTKDAATIRGRSPYMQGVRLPSSSSRPETPKRSASASQSQTSLWAGAGAEGSGSGSPVTTSGIPSRTTRLSNVEEHVDDVNATPFVKRSAPSPVRTRSGRIKDKMGSVRSMPPQPLGVAMPELQLAMTPENIKPLLENAKEVHARLTDCIKEVRALLVE